MKNQEALESWRTIINVLIDYGLYEWLEEDIFNVVSYIKSIDNENDLRKRGVI